MRKPIDTSVFDLKPTPSTKRARQASRDRCKGDSGVYFIECDGSDLVKIGRSTDIKARMRAIKSSKGAPSGQLRVWGVVRCDKDNAPNLESALHEVFADHRHDGEWFKIRDKDIRGIVCQRALEICEKPADIVGLFLNVEKKDDGSINPKENVWMNGSARGMVPRRFAGC